MARAHAATAGPGAVAQAETFVDTVERVFSLEKSIHHSRAEDRTSGDDDKVSDAGAAKDDSVSLAPAVKPFQEEQAASSGKLATLSQPANGRLEGRARAT
jgi:hypothetical protein